MFSFILGTNLGRCLLGALVAVVAWFTWLYYHDTVTKERILADWNRQQLEQVLKDQKEFRLKMDRLEQKSDEIKKALEESLTVIDEDYDKAEDELKKLPDGKKQASPYLKETIRRLKDLQ